MGKRIRAQRKGRGSPTFSAPTHKRVAPAQYPAVIKAEEATSLRGVVEELTHDPGRGSPLARIRLDRGAEFYNVASEGLSVGSEIFIGTTGSVNTGNILPLSQIPSGTMVNNIEFTAGDGGKIARSSGAYATVVSQTAKGVIVKLPSGKSAVLDGSCRATIGVVSGSGRTSKPFMKAGKKVAFMKAKGRAYPITKGVAMIAALHPHGGGSHKTKSLRPTSVSRHMPPGKKVGLISPRQSGRKKRRRIK